ncbi:MAG: cation transporter [Taibaiella sp.]|nr:cation transporter [Taibaiella sp.]
MNKIRKALGFAVILNTLLFVVEGITGLKAGSISLLMDSVHNFSDELALICLFLAYSLPISMSRNLQRIANFLNSIGLIIVSLLLIKESVERFYHPTIIMGYIPIVTGLFVAAGNWGVVKFLATVKDENAAIRLAYLHNVGDIYVSLAPVLAGVLILVTGSSVFDPIIAIGAALYLIFAAVREIVSSNHQLIWPDNVSSRGE